MADKQLKDALFYGQDIPSWYNAPLPEPPTQMIDTPFGETKLVVNGDRSVAVMVLEPVTINRIPYRVQGTYRNTYGDYTLRQNVDRVVLDDSEQGWFIDYANKRPVTDAAYKKIRDTLEPLLAAWVKQNANLIDAGERIEGERRIAQARAKIENLQRHLDYRTRWLQLVEGDLEQHGELKKQDRDRLEVWDRYWRFG